MELRNASFFEDVFPCRSKEEPSSSKQMFETFNENSYDQDKDCEVEPKRSKRVRTKKIFWSKFFNIYARRGTSEFQRDNELYRGSYVERGH